jgi:cytidine deaminase
MLMDTQVDDMIVLASAARSKAYAPYSEFDVGAAVECKSGAVLAGANIKNRSLGLTIFAERVAMGAAVAGGERDFIAITSNSDQPIAPCGACRQFLAEFKPDLIIVSPTVHGERKIGSLSRLLPESTRGILKHVDPS